MSRHSWSEKVRPDQTVTKQFCRNCHMHKHMRHENGRHWEEFYRDGERIWCEKTPPCEVRVNALEAAE
jgi:hypothetical protein